MKAANTGSPAGRRRRAVALIVAMLVGCEAGPLQAGDARAPDVELRDANGRRLRLAEFRGKVTLVDFWASWCKPCEASFPALDALYREYRARGVEVVAVNLDARRKDADAFLRERPHEVLVVFDPRAQVMRAFGAPGIPSSYVIDRQGIIRYSNIGHEYVTSAQHRRQLDALLAEPGR